jgi:hypothetical protein
VSIRFSGYHSIQIKAKRNTKKSGGSPLCGGSFLFSQLPLPLPLLFTGSIHPFAPPDLQRLIVYLEVLSRVYTTTPAAVYLIGLEWRRQEWKTLQTEGTVFQFQMKFKKLFLLFFSFWLGLPSTVFFFFFILVKEKKKPLFWKKIHVCFLLPVHKITQSFGWFVGAFEKKRETAAKKIRGVVCMCARRKTKLKERRPSRCLFFLFLFFSVQ